MCHTTEKVSRSTPGFSEQSSSQRIRGNIGITFNREEEGNWRKTRQSYPKTRNCREREMAFRSFLPKNKNSLIFKNSPSPLANHLFVLPFQNWLAPGTVSGRINGGWGRVTMKKLFFFAIFREFLSFSNKFHPPWGCDRLQTSAPLCPPDAPNTHWCPACTPNRPVRCPFAESRTRPRCARPLPNIRCRPPAWSVWCATRRPSRGRTTGQWWTQRRHGSHGDGPTPPEIKNTNLLK